MAQNDFAAESPENHEEKSICCFVVDVSGSMDGEPIRQLNDGLQQFHREIADNSMTANRLEVALVEFSNSVETVVQPALAESFSMPRLTTKGTTKLVDGVREAIGIVQARKDWYKRTGQPYKRPWIILITDGVPDRDQDVNGLADDIRSAADAKTFMFFAVGVQGANMDMLRKISSDHQPPAPLEGLKFIEFFRWVSGSMSTFVGSKTGETVALPSPEEWMANLEI